MAAHAPVEPPPTPLARCPPRRRAPTSDGLVGVGADLEPGTLLAAYRTGLFPMPCDATAPIGWWSPDPRGVLPLDGLRVSRSLRRSCAATRCASTRAFEAVMRALRRPAPAAAAGSPADVRRRVRAAARARLGAQRRDVDRRRRARRRPVRRARSAASSPASRCSTARATRRRSRSSRLVDRLRGAGVTAARRAVGDAAPRHARRDRDRRDRATWSRSPRRVVEVADAGATRPVSDNGGVNERGATERDQPWLMRTYSGHSTATASNELYRTNLAKGQTGLSIAFDLPTQTGYDPDYPLAQRRGRQGRRARRPPRPHAHAARRHPARAR